MIERGMQFIEQEHILDQQPRVYVVAPNATQAIAAQEKIERKGGIRLTTVMKASIIEKVYDFKFKKPGDALDKLELKLSHRAMVGLLGNAKLDQLRKIGPPYAYFGHNDDGDLPSPDKLAEWKGTKVTFRVGSLGYQIALYVKDPLPMHAGHYSRSKFYTIKDGKLSDEIVEWQQACEAWTKEKHEMAVKINAVLNSVTTFTSLQKTWPTGERFFKHIPIDFPFRNQVPAVRVDELNAALGI